MIESLEFDGLAFMVYECGKIGRNIHIIDIEGPDISELLNLRGALLALSIRHIKIELFYSALDSVPTRKSRREVDVSCDAEVGGVDDFVCAWVGKDGLGVDTGLVGEGAETGDVVVEGDIDLHGLGNQVLEILELVELVLGQDVVAVGNDHAGHKTAEGCDSVAFTDTENGGIDMCGTGLERAVGIGDSTAGIVVEMCLNVTRHDSAEGADKIVNLARTSASDSVGDTLIGDGILAENALFSEVGDRIFFFLRTTRFTPTLSTAW
jgi:hypothetical protein